MPGLRLMSRLGAPPAVGFFTHPGPTSHGKWKSWAPVETLEPEAGRERGTDLGFGAGPISSMSWNALGHFPGPQFPHLSSLPPCLRVGELMYIRALMMGEGCADVPVQGGLLGPGTAHSCPRTRSPVSGLSLLGVCWATMRGGCVGRWAPTLPLRAGSGCFPACRDQAGPEGTSALGAPPPVGETS